MSTSHLRHHAVSQNRAWPRTHTIAFVSGSSPPPAYSACRLVARLRLDAYPAYGGTLQRTVRDAGNAWAALFDPAGKPERPDLAARADSDENDAETVPKYSEDKPDGDDENATPDPTPNSGQRRETVPNRDEENSPRLDEQ